jgi:hypothetical protein
VNSSGTFYDEATLPPNGTESLSNLPGDVKTATSATLVWSLVKGVPASTAIAAPYQTPAGAAASASPSMSAAAGSTVVGSSVAGSSAAGASKTASAATSKSAGVSLAGWLDVGLEVKVGMLVLGALLYL